MTPGQSGGGGHGGGMGGHSMGHSHGYSGGPGACGYVQAKASQEPKYDNCVRKRRKKKKKNDS